MTPTVARPEIKIPATKVFLETWQAIQSNLYKLICQEGSSRSSKTWSDFQIVFKYGYDNYNKVITVLRDTATDCRDIVESEFVKWINDPCGRTIQFETGEITLKEYQQFIKIESLRPFFNENRTKHIWEVKKSKSTIRFTGLDDEDKVMGMSQNVCWINEPYNFPHEVYRQLSQRTSDFIIIDWNPKKTHWIDQEKKKETSIVLASTFRDNPFCPPKQKAQILSYQPVSMCEVVLSELITEADALVYDVIENRLSFTAKQIIELSRCKLNAHEKSASLYHWNVFGLGIHAELPNRIFHWTEISLADYQAIDATVYNGCDWGAVDPWAVGELKYYDGCLYLRELNYESENTIRARLTPTELQQIGLADEGIVSWLFNKIGVDKRNTIVCDPNRITKIMALRDSGFEYSIAAQKPPGSIVDGIDLLNNLRVFYTSDSPNIKHEQENYSRKVDRYGIVLEEPEDTDNHHMDWVRYVATFLQSQGVIRKI